MLGKEKNLLPLLGLESEFHICPVHSLLSVEVELSLLQMIVGEN
jgi:hypothetical protein